MAAGLAIQNTTNTHLPHTEGVADVPSRSLPAKARVLGLLGWNSYGTEGAQPVAKVGIAKLRKMA